MSLHLRYGQTFRMWMANELCPSAVSVWEFKKQKEWAENCGLQCKYTERLWDEDKIEEERRVEADRMIHEANNCDMGAVAWDVGDGEWGVITGYDDEKECYQVLKPTNELTEIAYSSLGKLMIPILSVLTVTGGETRNVKELVRNTKRIAYEHLSGQEWCDDNVGGIKFYDAFTSFLKNEFREDQSWGLHYYLNTYTAGKYYAWKFFEKYEENQLSTLYSRIYALWNQAYQIGNAKENLSSEDAKKIAELLEDAGKLEKEAMNLMA